MMKRGCQMKDYKIATKCVRAGYKPGNKEPIVLPIVQSTTYKYDSGDAMGKMFDLEDDGYFYTRLANPTNDAVPAKIAALEGGVAAVLTSSGQAANLFAVLNLCAAGDHVVSSVAIYGGTFNLFNVTLRRMGVDFTFVSPDCSDEELEAAFKENTKCVFGETLSNPSLNVLDIEKFALAAHRHGVPLIVDNTFPTPVNCRPFEFGHATQVGGVVVDSGNFDWTQNDKFPGLTTPDDSYHGIVYTERFGKAAFITKCVSQLMRDLGSIPSPHNAFLLNLGLETLPLRMRQHCENAQKVAAFLQQSDCVSWVSYPGLPGDPEYAKAQKYMPHGTSGVISFGVKGGREAATKFMDALELANIVTHVADCRTCVLHPASTTHRQLTKEQLEEGGVKEDLIRLSVGIEDADDIIDDLRQALEKATK